MASHKKTQEVCPFAPAYNFIPAGVPNEEKTKLGLASRAYTLPLLGTPAEKISAGTKQKRSHITHG